MRDGDVWAVEKHYQNKMELTWDRHDSQSKHTMETSFFYQEERRLFLMRMADKLCCVIYSSLVRLCKMQNLKYCFIVFKTRWQNYGSISLSVYWRAFVRKVHSYRVHFFLTNFLSAFIMFGTEVGDVFMGHPVYSAKVRASLSVMSLSSEIFAYFMFYMLY